MRQFIKKGLYTTSFDTDFKSVIANCASINRKDQDGTWLTSEMIDCYIKLHEMGCAHSVEVWENKELVGGLYGISLGNCFFGESMFSKKPNTSKLALITLCNYVAPLDFKMIDCQIHSEHLGSLGAEFISRKQFLDELKAGLQVPSRLGKWG